MLRRISLLIVILAVGMATQSPADPEPSRVFRTEGGTFTFMPESLAVEVVAEEVTTTVTIFRTGHLRIDGTEIVTGSQERKQLKRLVHETEKMVDHLDKLSAIVAAQQGASAESDQEKLAKQIQRIGKDLEKQNQRVLEIAMKLVERLPELGVLTTLFAE